MRLAFQTLLGLNPNCIIVSIPILLVVVGLIMSPMTNNKTKATQN